MNAVILTFHIAGGSLGLLSLALPLISKKGGLMHRRAGWAFVAGMGTAGTTGLLFALSFALDGKPSRAVFFGVLSMLLLEGLWSAVSAIHRKKAPEPSRRRLDYVFGGALVVGAVAAGAYGLLNSEGLLLGFSALALMTGVGDVRFAARPLRSRMAWWYQHMASMMGASIAAVTAFLVLNAQRLLDLPAAWVWLPWALPSVFAVPLFVLWIRRYKVRFGELDAA